MKPSERINQIYSVYAGKIRRNPDYILMPHEEKTEAFNEALFRAILDYLDEVLPPQSKE